MICPTCRGRQFIPVAGSGDDDDELAKMQPCPDCIGGIASSSDAAGSRPIGAFTCPRCAFVDAELRASEAYRDDTFPERMCDHCGQLYRGPAVYCSLECAMADA